MGGSKKKQKGKQKGKQKQKQTSAPKVATENKGRFRYVCLKDELDARGLRIVTVAADGNCFFRAVSDQLTGSEKDHGKIREEVVQYMESHHDEFAPFVEDDEGFEKYMKRMRKNSTWAGHMEVQATSMCYDKNIHIYQQGQPTWRVVNLQPADTSPCLHLSFHDGEHYNSVRCQTDSGGGVAEPIQPVESSCDSTADEGVRTRNTAHSPACVRVRVLEPQGQQFTDVVQAVFGEKDVRQVSENTACFDLDSIKDSLATCGNVEDATEMTIKRTGQQPDAEGTVSDTVQARSASGAAQACAQGASSVPAAPTGPHVDVKFKLVKKKQKNIVRVSFTLQVEARASSENCQTGVGRPEEPAAAVVRSAEKAPIELSSGNSQTVDSTEAAPAAVEAQAENPADVPAKAPVKGKGVKRVGKNKQCPCGSGKKYKKCCQHAGKAQPQPDLPTVRSPSSLKGVTAPTTPKRVGSIDI